MRTLTDWENTLTLQAADGEILLGQLPLNAAPYDGDDMHRLGALLREVFAKRDFRDALALIRKRYPLSFALYLVLHGVYSYSSGEYWPAPGNELEIVGNHYWSYHCGKAFRAILRQFNLPTFEHVGGLTNLVPILAHGGIPNNSLNDFFRLLHRSVRGSVIALDAETLIDDWSLDPEETFYFIDKPVERFLLYGDEVAIDFLDRCLSMVEAESEEEMAELGLPQRVVTQYGDWRIGQTEQQLKRAQIRLARPFLYLDPYSAEGICLALPPQKFTSAVSLSKLDWALTFDGQTNREIFTERNRIEGGYEFTVPEIIPLPVREEFKIVLRRDATEMKTWILEGLSEEQFWQFDPDTGELFNRWSEDQPGERWIVYHNKYDLQVESGIKTAELPQQYGEWGQYVIEAWTLSPGGRISLVSNDVIVHEIEITEAKALRKPYLHGGSQPLDQQLRSKTPLYSGKPPQLIISSAQADARTQLARWHITIRGDGDTRPDQRITASLNELEECALHFADYQVAVDLSSPKLLGESPCGTFEIFARGPYGRGRRLGLRIVPHLEVSGHQRLYLSYDEGPAKFQMTCGEGSQIKAITAEGVICESQSDHKNKYQVESEPSVQAVQLVYIDHKGLRVPFTLRVRRPRWALWQSGAPGDFIWQTDLLKIHPESLADIYETKLLVDLPTIVGSSALYAGWRLINPDDEVLLSREPDMIRSQQQFTVQLGDLLPTYRHSQQKGESLLLQLWICHQQGDDLVESFVDMLTLIPSLDLGRIETTCEEVGSRMRLSMSWDSEQSVQELSLYLWPADQPWVEQNICIDVDCKNQFGATVEIDKRLLPGVGDYEGSYIGHLAIVDPWSGASPSRPGINQDHELVFVPDTADQYYAAIADNLESPEAILTALVYQFRMGRNDGLYTSNQQLRELAKRGDLPAEMLVAWANVTRELKDPVAYKLAQWTLFDLKVLETVESNLIDGQLQKNYLGHMPDKLPDSMSYLHLLMAGYPQVRRQCISSLCQHHEEIGLDELLEDVQTAKLSVLEAAKILSPVCDFAADYLLEVGSIDAMEVLTILGKETQKHPQWIEPGFLIDTGNFMGRVLNLNGGRKLGNKSYCKLEDRAEIDVVMVPESDNLHGTIDLAEEKILMQSDRLYQCAVCHKILASHNSILHHYHVEHTDVSPSFSVLRNREFRIKNMMVSFPN